MAGTWEIEGSGLDDLYEMAAIVEQGGFDFYARLIARAADPRVKHELKFLRDEEAAHKAFFLGRLRASGGAPRGTAAPALQDQLDREFLRPVERLLASKDAWDNDKTFSFGAAMEQKTIDLYTAMMGSGAAGQAADFERIIAEEKVHKEKLELMKAF